MNRPVTLLVGVWLGFHLAIAVVSGLGFVIGCVVVAIWLLLAALWPTDLQAAPESE